MTSSRAITSARAVALLGMLMGAAGNAQTAGPPTRPPGAPPGTTAGTPVVVPNSNPVVATPAPSSVRNGLTRGAITEPLPASNANARSAVATLAAVNPGPSAAAPWAVRLVPRNLPFRDGQCAPISIELLDASGKDTPRAPNGWRVSMADFDMNVTTATGAAVVGQYSGASVWAACACPGVVPGTVATITATYPSRSINAGSRVPGVAFQSSISLPVAFAPPGTGNPSACASIPPTTTIATNLPPGNSGSGSPASGSPAPTPSGNEIPPTTTVAQTQPAVAAQVAPGSPVASGAGMSMAYFAPASVAVTGNPAEAHVTWQPASRATGYTVTRWKATDPDCCRASSPRLPASTTVWTDLVQWTGPWMYRVTAFFPDGSEKFADAGYTYPEPQTPTGFTAVQTAPGTVTLSWQPVANASYYVLAGPPGNTAIRVDGTSVVRTAIPAGNHSWMIASAYQSSAGPQQGSGFVSTSLAVTAPSTGGSIGTVEAGAPPPNASVSGRYRVVATGFRVINETKDDMLSRDGNYDEVYGAFAMLHYDRRSSQLLDRDLRRTKVIGDVNHQPGRLQGGTSSGSGGFRHGDVFPAVADPSMLYGAIPTDQSFPFLIWDGTLTDAQDVLIILPTLWEFDGNADGYDKWFANEVAESSRIWSDVGVQRAVNGGDIGLITPPGSVETSFGPTFSAGAVFEMAFTGPGIITLFGVGSYDRPIGSAVGSAGGPLLPRRAIVITRENIETALRKKAAAPAGSTLPSGVLANLPPNAPNTLPNGGMPFGTIAVPLFDAPSPDLQGRYVLYLTVERIP